MATGQSGAGLVSVSPVAETLQTTCNDYSRADGFNAIAFERRFVRTTGGQPQAGVNGCLRADTNTGDGAPCVAIHGTQDPCTSEDTAFALGRNSGQENALYRHMAVRRLIPEECEALQGFPRGFTRIPWKAGFYLGNEDMPPEAMQAAADQCPDGPRYKALGNSMAVNCMEWIGQRIEHIERLTRV